MKFIVENIMDNKVFLDNPNALEKVNIILSATLMHAVEKKIDFDAHTIDENNTNYNASIHVMSKGEWKSAKELLMKIIDSHPNTESDIRKALSIIDPSGSI